LPTIKRQKLAKTVMCPPGPLRRAGLTAVVEGTTFLR
jgi:hypothetical protein